MYGMSSESPGGEKGGWGEWREADSGISSYPNRISWQYNHCIALAVSTLDTLYTFSPPYPPPHHHIKSRE